MATHRVSIINGSFVPDGLGSYSTPYNALATNDIFRHLVHILTDPAPTTGFYGAFNVPKNYVGTAKIIVVWTATATTGNVKLDFDYRAVGGDDAESLDQATFQEALTVTDAAPSAVNERMEASLTMTASNLAADDTVTFYLTREDGSGTDTMAASVIIHDVLFEYADA